MCAGQIALQTIKCNDSIIIELNRSFPAITEHDADIVLCGQNARADHVDPLYNRCLLRARQWPGDVSEPDRMPASIGVPNHAASGQQK